MDKEGRARVARIRNAASRQGLALMKSARRDPRAIDYGGYMLTDARDGRIVLGASPTAFSASLDDVETYLRSGAIYKKRDAEPAASA